MNKWEPSTTLKLKYSWMNKSGPAEHFASENMYGLRQNGMRQVDDWRCTQRRVDDWLHNTALSQDHDWYLASEHMDSRTLHTNSHQPTGRRNSASRLGRASPPVCMIA